MELGTKEFIEMRAQFEKDIAKSIYGCRFDRANNNAPAGVFYEDGKTNDLFIAYMSGASFMKCLCR